MATLLLASVLSLAGCSCGDTPPIDLGKGQTLVFVTQPEDAAAGATMAAMDVELRSSGGQRVGGASDPVTLTLAGGASGAVLEGTTTVNLVDGRAHFAGLSIAKAGTAYSLTASSGNATQGTSALFDIAPGAAARLAFVGQPADLAAGASIAPAVAVELQDALGNRATASSATVTLGLGANPGGATLGGTVAVQAQAGLAVFADLSLDAAGTGYTLIAESQGLAQVTSDAFNVSAAAGQKLSFVVQPSSGIAGAAISPAVQVAIQDGSGNVVTGATDAVTLALGTNVAGGTLGGTRTVNAVNGVATFADLSVDKAGGGYTLTASAGGLSGAISSAFDVAGAAAARLAFSVQPTSVVAGAAITPGVQVAAQDPYGNVDASYSGMISLSLSGGTAPLGGTVSAAAVNGVATFADLSVDVAGAYQLGATATGLAPASSSTFSVSAAAPALLAFSAQPTDGAAGAALAAVKVAVRDAYGNPVDSSAAVTLALEANPSGAALSGSTTVNAVSGVATFSDLSLNRPGTGYTLRATSPLLGDAVSNAFSISIGTAARLAFVQQPASSVSANGSMAVKVAVQDAAGNTVTGSSASVALSLNANGNGGSLSGSTSVAAVNGVATFSVSVDKAGTGYSLHAAATGMTAADSSTFDVTVGAAAKLAFSQQPPSGVASGASTTVKVTVQDAAGNTVTGSSASVALTLDSGANSGTLTTTSPVAAVNGVATFSFSVDKVGTGYFLHAASAGLAAADSGSFDVTAGAATRLAFTQQPPGSVASGASTTVKVTVQDAAGNTVTGSSASVALSLNANGNGGSLATTTPVAAVNGVATFNVSVDKAGTGYSLHAASSGLTAADSGAFDVTAGAAAKLAFTQQPPTSVTSGAPTTVKVTVQDAAGNTVTGSSASVALSLNAGANSGTLTTTSPVDAVSGVATFSVSVDKVGTGYLLHAASTGLTATDSSAFEVTAGSAAKLAFTQQPPTIVTSGASTTVKVTVQDAAGNTVTSASASVALTLDAGANAGTLTTTSPVSAVSGVATFSFSVDKVGTGYALHAASSGLTASDSSSFGVTAGSAAQLAFTRDPSNVTADTSISPEVLVAIQDAAGNTVTSATDAVTVALNAGANPGVLSGTLTVNAVAGVAHFADLSVDKAGAGYSLTATAGSLTATSSSFAVSNATATRLIFLTQPPSTVQSGSAISVEVALQDAGGNTDTGATAAVTISLNAGGNSGSLSGTVTANAVNGVATFSDLSVDKIGSGYSLHATSGTLAAADSSAFDVTSGAAAKLAFTQQPPSGVASGASTTVKVTVQDAAGNTVTGSSASVALTLNAGANSGALIATSPVNAASGVATFSFGVDKVGTGYSLHAASTGLTAADSSAFDVTAGSAAKLAFTQQPPTSVTSGASTTVKVTVQDAAGNTVTGSTASVALTLNAGANSGTLTATSPVNAASGVATFSFSVDKVGTGYSLHAASTGLTGADSSSFAVSAGSAAKLAFTQQPPSSVTSGASTTVKVTVQDAAGNTVASASASVALTLTVGANSGTLTATSPVNAASGVATFSFSVDKVGTGYSLHAASTGLTAADSSAFDVTAGSAAKLAFTQQPPSSVTSGASTTVKVTVQDAAGNTVTNSTASVALTLNAGANSGTLTATSPVNAASGVATFSFSVDKVGTGYSLHAASTGLTAADSSSFAVSAGSAAKLAFTQQPPNSVISSASTTVKVTVQDAAGNAVTASTASVALALNAGGNPGTLTTTSPVSAVGGVATFTFSVDKVGAGYSLHATSAGLTTADSGVFSVTAGAAAQLAFGLQPGDTTAGQAIAPGITVAIQDAAGNTVGSSTASVTVALASGPVATLNGTLTLSAVNGIATFSDLSINRAGTGYTLSGTSTGLGSTTSNVFAITAASASQLAFSTQPTDAAAGSAISPAVAVQLLDAYGNLTNSTASVSIALGANPGAGTLSGAAPVSAVGGVATFSGLSLDKSGTGYTLVASAGGATDATSSAFDVTAGTPSQLVFQTQPASTSAGTAISPAVAVVIEDALGNRTGSTANVTLAIGNNPGSGTLSGTATVAAVSGVATFPGLSIDKMGTGYTLAASAASVLGATSAAFDVSAGSATQLAFGVQPSNATVGAAIAPAPVVVIRDAFGNLTASTASVTLAIGTNPGSGSLGGTTSVAASAGAATFSNVSVSAAGAGYTLVASSGGLAPATSSAFDVTTAPATGLTYADPPLTGKIRLVRNAASTSTTMVLDLVTVVPLTGYSVALNLPVDTTRVQANASLFTAGTALDPGSAPKAATALLPLTGPLAGVVAAGQSQKAAGTGAIATDTSLAAGSVLFTLRLELTPGAPSGTVFDGAALGAKFRGALRDKLGNDVANSADFVIGKLSVL